MQPTGQFPFRSRGYYLRYAIADRLLPLSLFRRFYGDAEVLPRPLPGTPQMWLDAIAGNDPTAWKDATLILGGLEESDCVDPAPFIDALGSENEDVVFWSLTALGRIGAPAKSGLHQIAAALRHPEFGIRQAAIDALADLAINEDHVQSMLLTTLDDANESVRAEGVRALGRANKLRTSAIAKLQSLLHDPDESVRYYAEIYLSRHTQ